MTQAMATVLPTEYLSMNHNQAWRYTFIGLIVAISLEYFVIIIFYQTACTLNNYYYLENFVKFTIKMDKIKVKPATIWAHVSVGLVPLLIKFCASSYKNKNFQSHKLRYNRILPLYQTTTIDSKVFVNTSDHLQKNLRPVKISIEDDIELENVDQSDLKNDLSLEDETNDEMPEVDTRRLSCDTSQGVDLNEIQVNHLDLQPEGAIVRSPSNLEPRREFERSRKEAIEENNTNKGTTV